MLVGKTFTKNDYTPKSQQKQSLFVRKDKLTLLEGLIELYHSTLDKNDFQEVHLPPEMVEVAQYMYERHGFAKELVIGDRTLIRQNFKENPNAIIHLVTAGKDSTAMAKKEEGTIKHNLLVHVVGVNKVYPVEHRKCKQLYKKHFPQSEYHEIKVMLPQVKNQSESPLKNALITVLTIEYFGFVPKMISIGGSAGVSDISETEVFGDSSKGWNPLFNMIKETFQTKEFTTTPWLRDQIEPYEVIVNNGIKFGELASCMCQERFKKLQRTNTLDKFARVIKGKYYLAGTIKDTNQSIFDVTQDTLDKLDHSDIIKSDIIEYENDYRCTKCFKCNELALICHHHLGFNFHPDYIKSAERLLIEWMDKSSNNNGVNLWKYFNDFLCIPTSRIPDRYHKYLSGEAVRPDGWVPPKPKKKKGDSDETTEFE